MVSLVSLPAVLGAALLAAPGDVGYQTVTHKPFDREVKAVPDIWVLDFVFRKPRYIMTNVPGKGRKLVWYMTYKIVNRTGAERSFVPKFTLVTNSGKVYDDVLLPKAAEAVNKLENPTQELLNSVAISAKPIPPTKEKSVPVVRYGVVFWEDIDMADTKAFSIFVTGLSNGYVKQEKAAGKDGEKETKLQRKTLELKFVKPGDDKYPDPKEIKLVSEPNYIYR